MNGRIRRRRNLRTIRRTMAFFGYDLSHFKDKELVQIVQRINLLRKETGLSLEHAIKFDGELTRIVDARNKRSTL